MNTVCLKMLEIGLFSFFLSVFSNFKYPLVISEEKENIDESQIT